MSGRSEHGIFQFDRFSGLYLWALFIVMFGFWQPHLFLSQATLHTIASQQAISAIVVLALLFPLSAGAYDLSIGAVANLSCVMVSLLQVQNNWNMWVAIVFVILVCAVIGFVNGFIVVKLRVNSFIATLGTATIIGALQTIITANNQPNPVINKSFLNLTQTTVFGFQIVIVYLIVFAFIVWWALERTPAGRYLYAVGGNAESARLSGIGVGRWTWFSLTISSTLCGIAGILYASLVGPALTFGSALLLPAYAAAFLGSTQIKPGRFNVWGSLLAVFVLATGVQGLQLVTGVQWLNEMFSGVALVAAVAFATWRQGVAAKRRRQPTQIPTTDPTLNGKGAGATSTTPDADPHLSPTSTGNQR